MAGEENFEKLEEFISLNKLKVQGSDMSDEQQKRLEYLKDWINQFESI